MNDETLINNYLLLLKSSVEVYVHGTLESSNEDVRNTLKESLNDIMSSQADTYDLMVHNNWYQVNNVQTSEIDNTLNKLKSKEE